MYWNQVKVNVGMQVKMSRIICELYKNQVHLYISPPVHKFGFLVQKSKVQKSDMGLTENSWKTLNHANLREKFIYVHTYKYLHICMHLLKSGLAWVCKWGRSIGRSERKYAYDSINTEVISSLFLLILSHVTTYLNFPSCLKFCKGCQIIFIVNLEISLVKNYVRKLITVFMTND